jgi:hypothetical protein
MTGEHDIASYPSIPHVRHDPSLRIPYKCTMTRHEASGVASCAPGQEGESAATATDPTALVAAARRVKTSREVRAERAAVRAVAKNRQETPPVPVLN